MDAQAEIKINDNVSVITDTENDDYMDMLKSVDRRSDQLEEINKHIGKKDNNDMSHKSNKPNTPRPNSNKQDQKVTVENIKDILPAIVIELDSENEMHKVIVKFSELDENAQSKIQLDLLKYLIDLIKKNGNNLSYKMAKRFTRDYFTDLGDVTIPASQNVESNLGKESDTMPDVEILDDEHSAKKEDKTIQQKATEDTKESKVTAEEKKPETAATGEPIVIEPDAKPEKPKEEAKEVKAEEQKQTAPQAKAEEPKVAEPVEVKPDDKPAKEVKPEKTSEPAKAKSDNKPEKSAKEVKATKPEEPKPADEQPKAAEPTPEPEKAKESDAADDDEESFEADIVDIAETIIDKYGNDTRLSKIVAEFSQYSDDDIEAMTEKFYDHLSEYFEKFVESFKGKHITYKDLSTKIKEDLLEETIKFYAEEMEIEFEDDDAIKDSGSMFDECIDSFKKMNDNLLKSDRERSEKAMKNAMDAFEKATIRE